jgi:glycine dehydrogenase
MAAHDAFQNRHIGPDPKEVREMLQVIGVDSVDDLIDATIPAGIRLQRPLEISEPLSEYEYLRKLREIASMNKVFRSYIGTGYYNTITPSVIRRNILENPGWYTQYTPYQAEIAQGRLEALLNYQTMVSDLTGLEIANASLLDEGTSASEAMLMFYHHKNKRKVESPKFFVDNDIFPQTLAVLRTKAEPLCIEIELGDFREWTPDPSYFGALFSYPSASGAVNDYREIIAACKEHEVYTTFAADILSLALLTPPGELGADCAVGSTQRMGIPMGYGGPHAGYFATHDTFKREIPGRIIGVSVDSRGKNAMRMALQTREQHIRREKATSNICTAQALLAIMAGMYAAYHGKGGIKEIATEIHSKTGRLAAALNGESMSLVNSTWFDTLSLSVSNTAPIRERAEKLGINFAYPDDHTVRLSIDETVSEQDLADIFSALTGKDWDTNSKASGEAVPTSLQRTSEYLTHEVFNRFRSETEMMRYIKRLENKDLSLAHSMIALGSCTMKLNAASELLPITWPEFSSIHPFVPADQVEGYRTILEELEKDLCEITRFDACSLQPNSGAQGEYSGLMVIRAYHLDRGDTQRVKVLIPASAHGTNPASAVMAGMEVVVVKSTEEGYVDVDDLRAKAEEHSETLAGLMVTYPSTHGVFEETITEVCTIIHDNGGLVYMDGANMNAQVGLTSPAHIGADVCHLNLHKTFAIPHGGGGPGMGPICVNDKLAPYLPGHPLVTTGGEKAISPVNAAPFGSASILLISYGYIKMLGAEGCTESTRLAILNANYLKARLEKEFDILYVGNSGKVAHEFIVDFRKWKNSVGLEVEDVAKRLMDYGFHAPTVSFPVAGTMMIEPTESEGREELDRFCDAMLSIREEIRALEMGTADEKDNVLKNAPHTLADITDDEWTHPYTRKDAAYPVAYLHERKFWTSVNRINNTHGDRNLICVCPPMETYMEEA